MANQSRNPSTQRPDPRYPFRTELNEKGQTVFYVPVEVPQDRIADYPISNEGRCMTLHFKGGKSTRVHFVATTDRQYAFDQRRWLNTQHTRERRQAIREEYLEGARKEEDGETIPRDENPLLADTDDGYIRADYSDLPELIAEFIGKRYPKNPLYREIYKLLTEEMTPKDISVKLGIKQEMVYYYQRIVYGLAIEYKRKYIDND